jgi:nicotinamide riboside kinase
VFEFYRQTTPREALRSFVRAVERRRYDVVLAFVPEQYRERMSADGIRELWEGDQREEILQLLENLRASLDEPIEEVGERASMQYMDRYTCRFVREGGVWRIEDPD